MLLSTIRSKAHHMRRVTYVINSFRAISSQHSGSVQKEVVKLHADNKQMFDIAQAASSTKWRSVLKSVGAVSTWLAGGATVAGIFFPDIVVESVRSQWYKFIGTDVLNKVLAQENDSIILPVMVKDPYHVERLEAVASLDRLFTRQSKGIATVVLDGLAGAGKTELALQFAYAYQERIRHLLPNQPLTIKFFIAEFKDDLMRQYREFANELGIAAQDLTDSELPSYVATALKNRGRWLLVFDNLGNAEAMPEGTSFDFIEQLIPPIETGQRGWVLITTRDRFIVPSKFVKAEFTNISTTGLMMKEEEACRLIQNVLGEQFLWQRDLESAKNLSQRLKYYPNAIMKAASYAKVKGKTVGEVDKDLQNYFVQIADNVDPNIAVQKFIIHSISWDKHTEKVAEVLLGFAAFLSPDNIQRNLFFDFMIPRGKLDCVLPILKKREENPIQYDTAQMAKDIQDKVENLCGIARQETFTKDRLPAEMQKMRQLVSDALSLLVGCGLLEEQGNGCYKIHRSLAHVVQEVVWPTLAKRSQEKTSSVLEDNNAYLLSIFYQAAQRSFKRDNIDVKQRAHNGQWVLHTRNIINHLRIAASSETPENLEKFPELVVGQYYLQNAVACYYMMTGKLLKAREILQANRKNIENLVNPLANTDELFAGMLKYPGLATVYTHSLYHLGRTYLETDIGQGPQECLEALTKAKQMRECIDKSGKTQVGDLIYNEYNMDTLLVDRNGRYEYERHTATSPSMLWDLAVRYDKLAAIKPDGVTVDKQHVASCQKEKMRTFEKMLQLLEKQKDGAITPQQRIDAQSQLQSATKDTTKQSASDTRYTKYLNDAGRWSLLDGKIAEAKQFFEKTVKLYNPGEEDSYLSKACFELGKIYIQERQWDLAWYYFQKGAVVQKAIGMPSQSEEHKEIGKWTRYLAEEEASNAMFSVGIRGIGRFVLQGTPLSPQGSFRSF